MKKIFLAIIAVTLFLSVVPVTASSIDSWSITSSSSAPADGKSTISVYQAVEAYQPGDTPPQCAEFGVLLSPSTNLTFDGVPYVVFNPDTGNFQAGNHAPLQYSPSLGTNFCAGTFTVASSVAQTVTATLYQPGGKGSITADPNVSTLSLKFTSVTTSTPTPTPKPTTPTKTTPPAPITYSITPPTSTIYPIVLWNSTNFGVSGQSLAAGNSATTSVGISDKNNIPLALVSVNLGSNLNWSSVALTYATSPTDHKSFVHGLTSAPGVNNGTFTLYVPYAIGNQYVGICPGTTSLSLVDPNCAGIYYLSDNQTKTHSEVSSIPQGISVNATIASVNSSKYWVVSGLTGTGGFSAASTAIQQAAITKPLSTKSSNTAAYIIGGLILVLLVVLGATYKLWMGSVRRIFKRGGNKPQQPPIQPPSNPPSNDNIPPSSAGGQGLNNTNIGTPSTNQDHLNDEPHAPSDNDSSGTS